MIAAPLLLLALEPAVVERQAPGPVTPPAAQPSSAQPPAAQPPAVPPSAQPPAAQPPAADPGSPGGSRPPPEPAAPVQPPGANPTAPPGTPADQQNLGDPFKRTQPATPSQTGLAPAGTPQVQAPLPPPPDPVDPRRVSRGPWRGTLWFDFQFDVVYPVGGTRPAEGTIISGGGTVRFGWRIKNWTGIHMGIGGYIHDGESRTFTDASGWTFQAIEYGRMTQWDIFVARFYAPLNGRVQPWLDVGGGALIYQPPFDQGTTWGGHFVSNLGFDGWVATNFSLGLVFGYRLLGLEDEVGHALSSSIALGAHW